MKAWLQMGERRKLAHDETEADYCVLITCGDALLACSCVTPCYFTVLENSPVRTDTRVNFTNLHSHIPLNNRKQCNFHGKDIAINDLNNKDSPIQSLTVFVTGIAIHHYTYT